MRFIKIKNNGLIEPEALHLVGASTKRGDNSKIGQFGSGNKYAMAYLLRNNYQLVVYSGLEEIKLETKVSKFREHDFEVVHINGQKTSITTQMGKDWQFWQALREIVCNAMDEGGYSMDFVSNIEPVEGETHFYIRSDHQVVEFMTNFDNYFATNKDIVFECADGRIMKKSGDKVCVYRKGIRCYETEANSMYDYDFNSIAIGENRLVQYTSEVREKIWDLIFQCDDAEVIKQILCNMNDYTYLEADIDYTTLNHTKMSDTFKKLVKTLRFAPSGYAGLLDPDEVHQYIIIPTNLFDSIKGILPEERVPNKFKTTIKGSFFRDIEPTELQKETLKQSMDFFNEVNYEIPYDIQVVVFQDKKILGTINKKDGLIYLSDICIAKGVNEVVNTIIEEFIHLKYDVQDKTRAFQTAAITELIEYMKKANAYAI